jgi:hypothetical protein
VHADDVLQQVRKARALDGHAQHVGVAIAQDAGRDAALLQFSQHLAVFREGAEVAVLVHQPLFGRRSSARPRRAAAIAQGGAGDFPERAVVFAGLAVAAAHGHQAGVFDLLVAPQHGLSFSPWPGTVVRPAGHAVHVEQGAVGVEEHRAQFHAGTLFDTPQRIKWVQ